MAERNHIKDRKCLKCEGTIRGKAHAVKEHAKTCDGTKVVVENRIVRLNDEGTVLVHGA